MMHIKAQVYGCRYIYMYVECTCVETTCTYM